jgi:Multiubiquitin
MSQTAAPHAPHEPHRHPVKIKVNNKPVTVQGPKTTGLTIKRAAIAAGVRIEESFQLSEVLPNREHRIVGDNEEIEVHEGSEFTAVADDDNS